MVLISNEYRAMNEKLHERPHYGAGGGRWASSIEDIMGHFDSVDVLDYGAGKQSLTKEIPSVTSYDPAVPEISELPGEHDIVACIDVLEHIEPDRLDAVLLHLFSVMKVCGLFVIATRPAKKTLPDGRNAHLIIETATWWISHIQKYFKIIQMHQLRDGGEFVVYVKPKRNNTHDK